MSGAHVLSVDAPWRVPFLGVQGAICDLLTEKHGNPPQPPAIVRLIRIAPPSRLSPSGLVDALAPVGVGVARWFGVDPLDSRLVWISGRETSKRGIYAVRIEIELTRDAIRIPEATPFERSER